MTVAPVNLNLQQCREVSVLRYILTGWGEEGGLTTIHTQGTEAK